MRPSSAALALTLLVASGCGAPERDRPAVRRRGAGPRAVVPTTVGGDGAGSAPVESDDAGPLQPSAPAHPGERLVPEGIVRIAAGTRQTCALTQTGRVLCWGDAGLLVARPLERHRPVEVPTIHDGVELTAGDAHTCALRRDGSVACWGRNVEGQLGAGTGADPHAAVRVARLRDAVAISAGGQHTCALRRSGAVVCFGDNREGQLGDGTRRSSPVPVAVAGLADATALSAGRDSTCAVRRTGDVVCWGSRGSAAFGVLDARPQLRPTAVPGLRGAVQVVTGGSATCAIDRSRSLVCVGQNHDGSLSPDRTLGTVLAAPQRPLGTTPVTAALVMMHKLCVLGPDGVLACWSGDPRWQRTAIEPQRVGDSDTRFQRVTGSYAHLCGLAVDGAVLCTGQNYEGQLGRERGTDCRHPNAVALPEPVATVHASETAVCATSTAGNAYCWGSRLPERRSAGGDDPAIAGARVGSPGGGPTPPTFSGSPVPEPSLGLVRDVWVGTSFLCALDRAGAVRCRGDDSHGQLGDGHSGGTAGVTGLAAVSSGDTRGERACVIHGASRDVSCWGEAAGPEGQDSAVPARRAELRGVSALAVGDRHACAVTAAGTVRCWGDRAAGRLGDGEHPPDAGVSWGAVEVSGLAHVRSLAAGGAHSCAITADGAVWCWGAGFRGQLGDGGRLVRWTPVPVPGIRDAVTLGLGPAHSCAATRDGALYCWGYGSHGQLGLGSSEDRLEPTRVPGLTAVSAVAAAEGFTCAVHGQPARVSCWGESRMGVLGARFTPGPDDPVMSTGGLVRALW